VDSCQISHSSYYFIQANTYVTKGCGETSSLEIVSGHIGKMLLEDSGCLIRRVGGYNVAAFRIYKKVL